MSRYAKRLDRDLVRWREAGWINTDGEAAIRRDIAGHSSQARPRLRARHPRRRAHRLRRHELRCRALERDAEAVPARHDLRRPVRRLRPRRSAVRAQASDLRARRRSRRRRHFRRRHHAHRADVPHRGASARRGADLGAGRARCRRHPAIQSGAGARHAARLPVERLGDDRRTRRSALGVPARLGRRDRRHRLAALGRRPASRRGGDGGVDHQPRLSAVRRARTWHRRRHRTADRRCRRRCAAGR